MWRRFWDARPQRSGQTKVCTGAYQLTQADVDAGGVSNTAVAQGTSATSPEGTVLSDPSSAKTWMKPQAGLKLPKTSSGIKADDFKVGVAIEYKSVVENIGDVTVSESNVNEQKFTGTGKLSAITCPEGADILAPGQSFTCMAQYQLTEADAKAGQLSNTAVVVGELPDGSYIDSKGSQDSKFKVVSPEKQTSTAVVKPGSSLAVTGAAVGGTLLVEGALLMVGFALTHGRSRDARHK